MNRGRFDYLDFAQVTIHGDDQFIPEYFGHLILLKLWLKYKITETYFIDIIILLFCSNIQMRGVQNWKYPE